MSSLIRRLSSRRSRRNTRPEPRERPQLPAPDEVAETPVPVQTREMTTSNLFEKTGTTPDKSKEYSRTMFEVPQPAQVDAMTDLIKSHQPGSLFPYVGVVGSEGESSDARRSRMLALKPNYDKRDLPEIRVLGCPLISKEGQFTMSTLMAYAQHNKTPSFSGPAPVGYGSQDYSITKKYVHVRQVTILFSPNVSSTSNYCNFWMNLNDTRLISPEKGSQTAAIVSNQEGILELSCDYCIAVNELESYVISYTLERDIVNPGFQWGTVSFYFNITESDLPYQSSKVDAAAVYRMPITTLMDRTTNADAVDATFTPADLIHLREMFRRGDIVDVDQPQVNRAKTSQYSKSLRSGPKGKEINEVAATQEGWEFLKGARADKVDAMVASVEPDDSEVPIREVNQDSIDLERRRTLERYKIEQETQRMQSEKEVVHAQDPETDRESEDGGVSDSRLAELLKKQMSIKNVSFGPADV